MDFEIKRLITNEYSGGRYETVDLNELEAFVKAKLQHNDYGASVVKFFWGFELYKFDGGFAQFFSNDITSWKHSLNWLVSNSHFDWDIFYNLGKLEALQAMKTELLNSVLRIGEMKRKPKSFDYKAFYVDLDNIIDEYMTGNAKS
ncbi:hypothetical protein [Pedobacter helvus]|uniref:DUF4375 domain-containing protein n=1 Tax=Pedobacter helvus TaxID=2563444 RepID=A0ABW9JGI2_9SPHI|nr:hypothetical protein [Pedobacter ureilyticus]